MKYEMSVDREAWNKISETFQVGLKSLTYCLKEKGELWKGLKEEYPLFKLQCPVCVLKSHQATSPRQLHILGTPVIFPNSHPMRCFFLF